MTLAEAKKLAAKKNASFEEGGFAAYLNRKSTHVKRMVPTGETDADGNRTYSEVEEPVAGATPEYVVARVQLDHYEPV